MAPSLQGFYAACVPSETGTALLLTESVRFSPSGSQDPSLLPFAPLGLGVVTAPWLTPSENVFVNQTFLNYPAICFQVRA